MKKTFFLSGLVAILLLSSCVSADITLGSMVDVNSLTINKGEIGRFKVSFFNLGNDPLKVSFSTDYSKELRVELDPKKLTLQSEITSSPDCSNSECEWFILRDGKTYVKVQPVYVYVKIPPEVSQNAYTVKLTAVAADLGKTGEEGFKQKLAQAREITFRAYVPGSTSEVTYVTLPEGQDASDNIKSKSLSELYDAMISQRKRVFEGNSDKESKSENKEETVRGEVGNEQITFGGKAKEEPGGENEEKSALFGISQDKEGRTEVNLPTGKLIMSKENTGRAIDLGIITLLVSIGSLVVKILK